MSPFGKFRKMLSEVRCPTCGMTFKNKAELAFDLYLAFLREKTKVIDIDPNGLTAKQKQALLSLQDYYHLIKANLLGKKIMLLDIKD